MKQHSFKGLLCAIPFLVMGLYAQTSIAAVDAALEIAPTNGYAGQNGGTQGGSAAMPANIYTVSTGAQLRTAVTNGGNLPKIIKIIGNIDMTDGTPFSSKTDQSNRGVIKLGKYTTLIGMGTDAGIVNGSISINNTSNVIVRNLKLVAPCDISPTWDPNDGSTGSWNADYDAIHIEGSTNVWIDRNTITDAPITDDTLAIENGQTKQCHDGAIDITNASDYVTVSYNVIKQHDKTMLIGSDDKYDGVLSTKSDVGKLHVTIANNVFDTLTQRVPRVRFGTIHLFNNYFAGTRSVSTYKHSYSIGTGRLATVISKNNVFAITGASKCSQIVQYPSSSYTDGTFTDVGSTLNGAALNGCTVGTNTATVPYTFSARATSLVKNILATGAGSGKLTSAVVGSGNVTSTAGTSVPAKGEVSAYIDTPLLLAFDATPALGSTGMIKVFKASDDSLVTSIDVSSTPASTDTQLVIPKSNLEIDAIGLGAVDSGRARFVWYSPVSVAGNTATIKLKNNRLAYNTTYYVTIDASVFAGSTINGVAFAGINKTDGWNFTTKADIGAKTSVTVDDDGTSADFRTVQGALNHMMTNCGTTVTANACNTVATPKNISIANGSYNEMNTLRNVAGLSITGESRNGVIVGYDNFESLNSGSGATTTTAGAALSTSGLTIGHRVLGGGRAAFLIEGADLLTLSNFTLKNPHIRSTLYDNQAETIYFNTSITTAAARLVAKQMNFLSQQDTMQIKGYSWFYQSLIAGNVDYIWGNVMAALFEDSEIRHVKDTSSNSAGYLVQSRAVGTVTGTGAAATFSVADKGFVFLNSKLTADSDINASGAYLARNGNPGSGSVDQIVFINTKMGPHIQPAGWCVSSGKSNSLTFQQPIVTSPPQTGICTSSKNPPPQPDNATDTMGWREYGSMDLNGNLLDTSTRLPSLNVNIYDSATGTTIKGTKTITSSKVLTAIPAGYGSRAEIFANSIIATGTQGGWDPQP